MDKIKELLQKIDPDGKIFSEESIQKIVDTVLAKVDEEKETVTTELTSKFEEEKKELTKSFDDEKAVLESTIVDKDTKIAELTEQMESVDEDHTEKMKTLVEKFESREIDMVAEKIQKYVESFTEDAIPNDLIVDKVKLEKYQKMEEQLKDLLCVNDDYVEEKITEITSDLEQKYESKSKELDEALLENVNLKTNLKKYEACEKLEDMIKDLPDHEKTFVKDFMENVEPKNYAEKFNEAREAYKQKDAEENDSVIKNVKGMDFVLPDDGTRQIVESLGTVVEDDSDVDPTVAHFAKLINESKK